MGIATWLLLAAVCAYMGGGFVQASISKGEGAAAAVQAAATFMAIALCAALVRGLL